MRASLLKYASLINAKEIRCGIKMPLFINKFIIKRRSKFYVSLVSEVHLSLATLTMFILITNLLS